MTTTHTNSGRICRLLTVLLAVTAAFVVMTRMSAAGNESDGKGKAVGDPYPFDVCAVAGTKLGSMGEPIVYVYEGREVKFCCKGCLPTFEKDPETFLKKLDAKIIEAQLPDYPLTTCLLNPSADLTADDAEPVDIVYNNRLVRFCCKRCEGKFKKDPGPQLEKLDEAVIKAQLDSYPLDTCVVAGGKLGAMGEPANIVVNNRLVRLCCIGCEPAVRADSMKYLARIDQAATAKGGKKGDPQDKSDS